MSTPTIGFSMGPRDQERVQRLATRYAHGNRSAWLRQAIDLYEQKALFDTLAEVQARGDRRSAARGLDRDQLAALIAEAAMQPDSEHARRVAVLLERFQDGPEPDELPLDHVATERFMATPVEPPPA